MLKSRREARERRRAERAVERRKAEARQAFETAKAQAAETGGSLCGAYAADGAPVYFVVPAGASDAEAARLAFNAKRGRPMTADEEVLAGLKQSLWKPTPQAGTVALP